MEPHCSCNGCNEYACVTFVEAINVFWAVRLNSHYCRRHFQEGILLFTRLIEKRPNYAAQEMVDNCQNN